MCAAEPDNISLANLEFTNAVDTYAQVGAEFPEFSYSAVVSTRMFPRQQMTFHGEKGALQLTCPFNANVHGLASLTLETQVHNSVTETWPGVNHYVLQVENFCKSATSGAAYPCPLEFSRGTQKMIDMVFSAA